MKPVLQQIEVTVAQLQKLRSTDRIQYALDRLTKCQVELREICTDRGCGPEMVFPDPSV